MIGKRRLFYNAMHFIHTTPVDLNYYGSHITTCPWLRRFENSDVSKRVTEAPHGLLADTSRIDPAFSST
jgi:hypothetical protein